MTNIDPITYEDLLFLPISFEMTASQDSLPLFPSECAYELLMPLLNAARIPDTHRQVTALLLRICSVLESCSTASRLIIRNRVEATLNSYSYSALQALDVSHTQNGYFSDAESIDLARILAGLIHHSGAVNPPLPRRAPGEAAVANLRRKLNAYVAWKETKEVPLVAQSTHPRPSSVAGVLTPSLKTTNMHQRPHSAYGYNKTQRHSYATFAGPAPRTAFVQLPSPKRSPTQWLTCTPHLSTIKEPENDCPNGSSVFFPEWSPYRPLDSKTVNFMMTRATGRNLLASSQINSFTASLSAALVL